MNGYMTTDLSAPILELRGIEEIIEEVWSMHKFEPRDEYTLAGMSVMIKKAAPGNYTVEWAEAKDIGDVDYFVRAMRWKIKIVFADKHEELVWWLKWR